MDTQYRNEIENITDKVIKLIGERVPDELQNTQSDKFRKDTRENIESVVVSSVKTIISNGVYISLSKETDNTIKNDIELFRNNIQKKENNYKYTFNTFINNVFLNMYDYERTLIYNNQSDTDSNQQQTIKKSNKKVGHNIKMSKNIINKALISVIPNIKIDPEITECNGKYGFFVYIYRKINSDSKKSIVTKQKDNIKVYAKFDNTDLAKGYVEYAEKYASLPLYDRRRIFYRKIYKEIQNAFDSKDIWIYMNKLNSKNKNKSYHVIPHSIEKSEDNGCDYIAAFALDKKEYSNMVNIPIHNIIQIEEGQNISLKDIEFKSNNQVTNYKEMIENMENRLKTDGILYLCNEPEKVEVKLTQYGFDMLLSRSQYKPYDITVEDRNCDDDKRYVKTAIFHATQLQTFLFFFKFGKEAVVLRPERYRNDFIEKYKAALNEYETIKEKDISKNDV